MNRHVIQFAFFTWIFALCLAISLPLRGQVAGGTLSGAVTDASGAAVPNAEVTIKNSATGITKTIATNMDGFYTAPNLLPGNYEVAVAAAGFNTEIKTGIVINVGSQQVFITPSTKYVTFIKGQRTGRGVRENSSSPTWA